MKVLFSILLLLVLTTGCFFGNSGPKRFTVFRSTKIDTINLQGKDTSLQGFLDDLLLEIARREHFYLKFNIVENADTEALLDLPSADIVLGVLDETSQNEREYIFSDPLFAFGPVVIIRAQDTYDGLEGLKDKVVGYQRGYAGALEGRNGLSFIFKPYDQTTLAMEDLINGSIDAVILDSILAYQYANSFYAGKVKVASPPLKTTYLRLIVRRASSERKIVPLFNAGLKEVKQEGLYTKILTYWGLVDPTAIQK